MLCGTGGGEEGGRREVAPIGMLCPTSDVMKRLQSDHIKNKVFFSPRDIFLIYVPFCVNDHRISCFRDKHTNSPTVKPHQWVAFHWLINTVVDETFMRSLNP